MSRGRFFALCSLVLAGSFAGGYIANRSIPVAFAQDIVPPQNNVRATSFTLVDSHGAVEATLRGGPMGAELVINGSPAKGGAPRIEISGNNGIVIRNPAGQIMWRSPKSPIMPLDAHLN